MPNFDFLKSIGATKEAIAVLNDQPNVFATIIAVLIGLGLELLLLWYIHFATLKPEQKKKKKDKKDKKKEKKGKDNGASAAGRK
ncbi:hypothetical protein L249_2224 [Ophiocordyceps polyrhachis-furcata BCC 54312]|uniref:Uncharacterized protein n=1 Tax=Ophiocordyceps polyrhachis-furcata BCC 54312 TaxID=1330021 RepID=A0A367LMQ6_9HYPO|nr:hypothetical protein L249_2224 [Ophiocordyceps polyrhachis-furcata BCC 54312]